MYYEVKQALEENTARPEIVVQKNNTVRMSDAFIPVEREQSLKTRQITIDSYHQIAKPQTINSANERITAKNGQAKHIVNVTENKYVTGGVVPTPQKTRDEIISVEEYIRDYLITDPKERAEYDKACKENPVTVDQIRQMPGFIELEKRIENITGKKAEVSEEPTKEQKNTDTDPVIEQPSNVVPQNSEKSAVTNNVTNPQYKIIGEAFNSYIIVEVEEKILIIDKHAAHERIIFEQLKANMYSADVSSQLLMLPVEIMLMSDEVVAIEEYRREIEAVGFEFSTSRNMVLVNALPIGIEQEAVVDMFTVIADRIKNGTGNVDITRNIVFEKALYQASCKAAIKAGREYPTEHQKWVVDKLMQIPDITFCPHGRPVAMELSKKNIDRQFERT